VKLPVDIGNLVVSGTKITMETPHMSGYTPDQRPYEVWAKTATQDLTDPDHVDLRALRAKVLMEDKTTVTLDAHDGLFDSKQQLLDLHKEILLQSSTGYEASQGWKFEKPSPLPGSHCWRCIPSSIWRASKRA
jgi:lipopolysaccharide export system protein LptC